MMFFLCLFGLAVGYLLNEEASLRRICRAVSYKHEGWLVLHGEYGLMLLISACFFSVLKGYFLGLFLMSFQEQAFWGTALLFILGNVLSVKQADGLGYSGWLALTGLLFAREIAIFQAAFTVFAVSCLLTRNFSRSMILWRAAAFLFVLLFCPLMEALFWTALISLSIFCGRQSPNPSRVIEYCGRIFRWRVTL